MRKEQKEVKTSGQILSTFHYHPQIIGCQVSERELISELSDGRKVSIPLSWFEKWGFKSIRPEQLTKYEIWEGGQTIFFSEINEPLHVRTFTDGLGASCCC